MCLCRWHAVVVLCNVCVFWSSFVISSQSSLLDPLDDPHWSLFSSHQLTRVSRSQTTPFSMPHLTCDTSFLLLFVFLISSILHHHPALLHSHTLILDHLLTSLVALSTIVLKLSFSQSLSLYHFLELISWIMTTRCLAVTGRGSIGKCSRLSQSCSWLFVRTVIVMSHRSDYSQGLPVYSGIIRETARL